MPRNRNVAKVPAPENEEVVDDAEPDIPPLPAVLSIVFPTYTSYNDPCVISTSVRRAGSKVKTKSVPAVCAPAVSRLTATVNSASTADELAAGDNDREAPVTAGVVGGPPIPPSTVIVPSVTRANMSCWVA